MPRVQQKRGTAANLTSVNPTPLAGELLVVTDENTLKIGNGTDAYTSLAYVTATPRSHTQAWSTITSTPTTLSGYGITDAVSSSDARLSDTRTPTDGSVTTAKIADDAVTYAKIQNVSATDRLLGRSSAGAGDVQEITCTAFGRSLIDDADAAAGRATLAAAPAASPTFTGVVTVAAGSASAPALVASGDSNTGLLFPAADTVAISTAGVERLRVDAEGRVGIGATPSSWNAAFDDLVVGSGGANHGISIHSTTQGTLAFGDTASSGADGFRGFVAYQHAADSMVIGTDGTERMKVRGDGNIGIGYGGAATHRFGVAGNINGTGGNVIILAAGVAQPSVTTLYSVFSQPSVTSGAALVNLFHYDALGGTFNGTVGNQYGFMADASLTGATNNFGFRGAIPAGSGRWNAFMDGTASNYFAGQVQTGIGTAAAPAVAFNSDVNTGIAQIGGSDTWSVVTGGVERVRVKSTGAVRFVPLAADPASGEAGDVYYNSVDNKLRVYNGTSWVDLH